MQTFVIRHRVADFLKRFPPFDALSDSDLLEFAANARVKFHESEEYIFRQGDERLQTIWIVQQGRVELLEEGDEGEELRDVVGEGDLLGLECLIGDRRCLRSARTASDVLIYGVRAAQMEWLASRQPAVRQFVSAHFSVAGSEVGRTSWLDAEGPPPDFLRARLLTVPHGASDGQLVSAMAESRNSVVALVDSNGAAAGIVSAYDIIAGKTDLPPAVAAGVTTRAAAREMLRSRKSALLITANGLPDGRLECILTASDLALFCGHDPAGLVRSIRGAVSRAEIAPLLRQARRMILDALASPADVMDCCRMETEVVSALIDACFRLAARSASDAGLDARATPCCWVSFGGFARGDQLEPGLPMIAAVYDDAAEGFRQEDSVYFAVFTGEVMAWFHACGIPGAEGSWPEGSHPCMPLSEWTRLYSEGIRRPIAKGLHSRRELFDVRMLFGDEPLFRRLLEGIAAELDQHSVAIPLLANDTLAVLPPLTFFRGLVLELDGVERDHFDIGSAAIQPVVDAARVFALARQRLTICSTLDRLQAAEDDYPEARELLHAAGEAFRVSLYYQAASGARIHPRRLGKFDQRMLKTVFSSIHRLLEFTASRFAYR